MFVEKSQEELEKMSSAELQKYYVDKYSAEKAEFEKRLTELEANKENKELAEKVQKLEKQKYESLEKAIEEQSEVIKQLRAKTVNPEDVMSIDTAVKMAVQSHTEDLMKSKDGKHDFKMTIKAAGDMTLTGNVSGGFVPQPYRLPGVNNIAERTPKTYDMIPKLRVQGNNVEWVYEANQDGTIDGTAEGTAKDQLDNDFVVASVALKKRAAYFKVSTEMLTDPTFMETWLRNKLLIRLFLDVDNQCLNGDNTGQNLQGVISLATAFAAGVFAGSVDNANEVDVLTVAVNQIKKANQSVENLAIQVNPDTVTALKLEKLSATDKRYVGRLIAVAGQLSLDGVPIVENNNIPTGDYLVGDFSKALIAERDSIEISIGLDGNDFTKNMRTILGEWRGQVIIENNNRTAFVTGDFATDEAVLETP